MQKKIIEVANVDFDDVMYGLIEVNIKFIYREYGVLLSPIEVSHWNYLIDKFPRIREVWGNWDEYKHGEVIEGGMEFMSKLNQLFGKNNVNILTASDPRIAEEKDKMIAKLFPGNKVIHAYEAKHLYSAGSVTIDDNIGNVLGHVIHNNCPGIIFDNGYGWNQEKVEDEISGLYRVNNFDSAYDLMKEIRKNGH